MSNLEKENCALKLEKIIKIYGDGENKVQALKGIDLNFRKNEFVSILGPSGCGKTTLLNIIGGLDRYTSGDLIIEGKSTKNYNDKDWDAYRNNSIGFIFQSYNLIPHQTVLGNVELALELSGVKKAERKERAIKMLEKVGLGSQLHKKPNQLSGGQMQRVAIARALINDPEIILADEPTGALDTETSIQIMELLKEVAKDRLVIMVTHNPDLAKQYSTRIINLLDGEVVGDSNPFIKNYDGEVKTRRKPKMGFKTAFGLSLKNLISKRTRTILTSIAGSIGIIGVALVLALSNGFSIYMDRMQTDSLATYPLTISESSVDLSSFAEIYENDIKEKYPELNNVYVQKAFDRLTGMLVSNDLKNKNILNKITSINKDYYYDIAYNYGFDMNDYFYTDINIAGKNIFMSVDQLVTAIESNYNATLESAIGLNTNFVRQYIPTIQEMPNSSALLNEQYEILYSKDNSVTFESLLKEENKFQLILIVDEYNSLSDISLALLGYLGINIDTKITSADQVTFNSENDYIALDDILGKEFYLALNSDVYTYDSSSWKTKNELNKSDLLPLEVVGIARAKNGVTGILEEGIAYSQALTKFVIDENKVSSIAQEAKNNGSVLITEFDYLGFRYNSKPTEYTARALAAVDTPSEISIYAKDFDSKEKIKEYLDEYNNGLTEEQDNLKITYSDMMSMLFSALTTMVDAVTIVLVAFTSISLIVSSVMIGIITYVSVVERTKEIGVLRSLGASKGEISNVFNAETFLIGLFAGVLGIVVTYLLCIPINIVIGNAVSGIGRIALLNPLTALILVCISFCLTLVAGLIPSRIASKKDPVVALRSE